MPTSDLFKEWLQDRARARGYDIDSPRGGGRSQLADDAGVSRGQVGRALAGETIPDIGSQRGLAKALRVDLEEMLIRSGLCTPDDFPNYPFGEKSRSRDYSLDEQADQLGVTDQERRLMGQVMPKTVEIIRLTVANVEAQEAKRSHGQRGVGGHPRPQSVKADEPEE